MTHILITGATNGIGKVAALTLAKAGHRIGVHGRSEEKVTAVVQAIRAEGGEADGFVAELSDLDAVRRLADDVIERWERLDVLVNNAGFIGTGHALTAEGHEAMFAVNHLAPFLLTHLLLGRLKESAPARVVNVSSDAHNNGHIDFDQIDAGGGWSQYAMTKLANVLFTRVLGRRLYGTGVTVNALHPGFVASGFGMTGWVAWVMRLSRIIQRSPEQGADTLIWAASSPECADTTGAYFFDRRERRISREARDDAVADALWAESVRRTGVGARP